MKNENPLTGITLIILEVLLLLALFSFAPQEVLAGIGSPNTNTTSELTVGNTAPEIHNMSINGGVDITLTPNSTTLVECVAVIVDYNGEADITAANATFFDSSIPQSNPDDNNNHYTNSSCHINTSFISFNGFNDDGESALANCTFQILYYANAGSWNCTIQANDTEGGIGTGTKQGTISPLLSLGLPDWISYGLINATSVSNEQTINITNYGNVKANLSLEGYGANPNDGNAMNCTLGASKNISVDLEKYNLTTSAPGQLNFTQFQANYTNLTTTPAVKQFNLTSRTDDTTDDTIKPTYWRIYVPTGVAGTCTGNIVFGATQAAES
ncbi:hypothetical protein K8R30_02710 [archaeon]|nr:hypothetical protein [archaeon]